MRTIYLCDYYPSPCGMVPRLEVTEELYELLQSFIREQKAQEKKIKRNISYQSLYVDDLTLAAVDDSDNYVDAKCPDRRFIRESLNTLSIAERRRIILHYIFNLSIAAVARRECVSKSTVQYSLRKAIKKLHERFKHYI